jgi:cytochrome d ubiquinol oxidase subunit II
MLAGVVVANIDGYVITSSVDPLATSNPLTKTVKVVSGAWLNNYSTYSWMLVAPVLGIFAGLGSAWFSKQQRGGWAFLMSSLMMAGIILTAGAAMFPFLMPSSSMPNASLTVWDATSSYLTLKTMFIVACIFVPIVLSYTAYSFYVMRGRIKAQDLDKPHTIY